GWYIAGVALFYLACFALLGGGMRHFALSTVYATWSGLGVALVAVIGVIAFADSINLLKIVSLIMIIAGIIGINLSGISH
ncbi:MAG: SMR family transporter, partial [Pirellulales bacterium]|nr:SMR family transporter [Pirellulales bacterium]